MPTGVVPSLSGPAGRRVALATERRSRTSRSTAGARSITELLNTDWILNFTPGESTAMMDNLFTQHGVAPPQQHIQLAHSASLMLTLVQQTDMVTFCPWPLVETNSLRHSLVALQLLAAMPLHQRAAQRRERLRVLAPPTFARQILVHAPVSHDENAIAGRQQFGQFRRDDDHAFARLGQIADQTDDFRLRPDIDARRGFIKDQYLREQLISEATPDRIGHQ